MRYLIHCFIFIHSTDAKLELRDSARSITSAVSKAAKMSNDLARKVSKMLDRGQEFEWTPVWVRDKKTRDLWEWQDDGDCLEECYTYEPRFIYPRNARKGRE